MELCVKPSSANNFSEITAKVLREIRECLPQDVADSVESTTPLVTTGLLDSFSTLTLVLALEESWGVKFRVEDLDIDRFNTAGDIARMIFDKVKQKDSNETHP